MFRPVTLNEFPTESLHSVEQFSAELFRVARIGVKDFSPCLLSFDPALVYRRSAESVHASNGSLSVHESYRGLLLATDAEMIGSGTAPHRWVLPTEQSGSYPVTWIDDVLEPGDMSLAAALMGPGGSATCPVMIVDRAVDRHYGDRLRSYLSSHAQESHYLVREIGEADKSVAQVLDLVADLDELGIRRRADLIVAVGGGVLMDVVGFVASIYRRGTPYLRVPTTLVGLVDAGIGVKTGVNAHGKKNRLGSYWPPRGVLLSPVFLPTLSDREMRNGLAEIIKMAVVADAGLFELVRKLRLTSTTQVVRGAQREVEQVCRQAIDSMLSELSGNLWEQNLRRLVDFGHTFSPVLEMADHDLKHGEAVACDMALCVAFARGRGLLTEHDAAAMLSLLRDHGLSVDHRQLTPEVLAQALQDAVRHRDGHQHIPVPVGIGSATFVEDSTTTEWVHALGLLRSMTGRWTASQ